METIAVIDTWYSCSSNFFFSLSLQAHVERKPSYENSLPSVRTYTIQMTTLTLAKASFALVNSTNASVDFLLFMDLIYSAVQFELNMEREMATARCERIVENASKQSQVMFDYNLIQTESFMQLLVFGQINTT